MMEYWNINLKKMTFLYLIPVKRNFTINQLSILPEPNIPVFQYSIIPIVTCPLVPCNGRRGEASQLETPSSRFICSIFQENVHDY